MSKIGSWNTHGEPIWRRKGFLNKSLVVNNSGRAVASGGAEEPWIDISQDDITGIDTDFLELYNYIAPLFYQSFNAAEDGDKMKIWTANMVTTDLVVQSNYEIKFLGLCYVAEDLTKIKLVKKGDILTIKDLLPATEEVATGLHLFDLRYNESKTAYESVATALAEPLTLRAVCFYLYFGKWEVVDITAENEFSCNCIEIENKIYYRR